MANISLTGITKRFGDTQALKKVDLEVRDGEFMVFLGPSGCGKTTLLRMIAGLELPTTGKIMVGDRDVTTVHPARRDVAMVFQNYALYPHMSVFKNISLGLELRKTPKDEIERKVKWACELLQIGHVLDRKPKALSGGQRQRVALARVMVREPSVFLMDEPLSNVDAKLRAVMRAELARIHREVGITTIYVTHDQEEAMGLGDRITVMNFGEIEQMGLPEEIYDSPRNAFVARFVGTPGMNLVKLPFDRQSGTLTDGNGAAVGRVSAGIDGGYDKDVILLGFRGEDVVFVKDGTDERVPEEGGVELSAKLDVIERLGAQTELYMKMAGQDVVARRPSGEAKWSVGDEARFRLPPHQVHLFDVESGDSVKAA